MPNHVSHRLHIKGDAEQLIKFREELFTVEKEGELPQLDFNKVIPMPESVRSTESSTSVNLGLFAILAQQPAEAADGDGTSLAARATADARVKALRILTSSRSVNVSFLMSPAWVEQHGCTDLNDPKLVEWIKEKYPGAVASAENVIKAYAETGFPNWYDWSVARWGTKWNAYQTVLTDLPEGDGLELLFETAWSPPEPVLRAIAARFPGLIFQGAAFDEGWNFACHITGSGADFQITDVEANDETHTFVYGHPPEHEDDEVEEQPKLEAHTEASTGD